MGNNYSTEYPTTTTNDAPNTAILNSIKKLTLSPTTLIKTDFRQQQSLMENLTDINNKAELNLNNNKIGNKNNNKNNKNINLNENQRFLSKSHENIFNHSTTLPIINYTNKERLLLSNHKLIQQQQSNNISSKKFCSCCKKKIKLNNAQTNINNLYKSCCINTNNMAKTTTINKNCNGFEYPPVFPSNCSLYDTRFDHFDNEKLMMAVKKARDIWREKASNNSTNLFKNETIFNQVENIGQEENGLQKLQNKLQFDSNIQNDLKLQNELQFDLKLQKDQHLKNAEKFNEIIKYSKYDKHYDDESDSGRSSLTAHSTINSITTSSIAYYIKNDRFTNEENDSITIKSNQLDKDGIKSNIYTKKLLQNNDLLSRSSNQQKLSKNFNKKISTTSIDSTSTKLNWKRKIWRTLSAGNTTTNNNKINIHKQRSLDNGKFSIKSNRW